MSLGIYTHKGSFIGPQTISLQQLYTTHRTLTSNSSVVEPQLLTHNIPTTATTTTTQPPTSTMHFGKRFSTSSNASFASSTDTLTSVTSTNTAVSTSTLAPSKQGRTEKDYFAAQGALQSTYGFGGAAPVIPTVSSSPKTKKLSTASSASSKTSTAANSRPAKDWEAAYATLSSQYGFGGTAPMVPSVPKSSK